MAIQPWKDRAKEQPECGSESRSSQAEAHTEKAHFVCFHTRGILADERKATVVTEGTSGADDVGRELSARGTRNFGGPWALLYVMIVCKIARLDS